MMYIDLIKALRWIRQSRAPYATRIVNLMAFKADTEKTPAVNATMKTNRDLVLSCLVTKQVSQTFCAALVVHT